MAAKVSKVWQGGVECWVVGVAGVLYVKARTFIIPMYFAAIKNLGNEFLLNLSKLNVFEAMLGVRISILNSLPFYSGHSG